MLGEYDLANTTALVAGPLLGAAVAEAAGVAARREVRPWLVAVSAALAGGGMLWAVWISTSRFRNPVPTVSIAGVVIAGAAAAVWLSTGGRRRSSMPPAA